MFTKLRTAYQIASNLGQIQAIISATFLSIVKTADILEYVLAQSTDTKLGKVVNQYLPPVISILSKVRDIILKYGKYVGFEETVSPQTVTEVLSLDELAELNKQLDELLK
jgi:hypothetical protein